MQRSVLIAIALFGIAVDAAANCSDVTSTCQSCLSGNPSNVWCTKLNKCTSSQAECQNEIATYQTNTDIDWFQR